MGSSTCDRSLDFHHGFFGSEERSSIIDDFQGGTLVYPSLKDEVLL